MSKISSVAVLGAVAAITLSACATTNGAPAPATLIPATRTPQVPFSSQTAPPPTTVTVTATPVTQQVTTDGPFQTPSGNIRCSMSTYSTGGDTVRCEITDHTWEPDEPVGCQLNWGDRVVMDQGSMAEFGCYGQEMPAPTHTLEYGQLQTHGTLGCVSKPTGVTCTDGVSGHYFFISRDTIAMS
jgi:hypothetical protein